MIKVILKNGTEIEITEEQKIGLEGTWYRNNNSGLVWENDTLSIKLDDIEKFISDN